MSQPSGVSPERKALITAAVVLASVKERALTRRDVETARVLVPRNLMLALLDAVETALPGYVEIVRELSPDETWKPLD